MATENNLMAFWGAGSSHTGQGPGGKGSNSRSTARLKTERPALRRGVPGTYLVVPDVDVDDVAVVLVVPVADVPDVPAVSVVVIVPVVPVAAVSV